MRQRDRVSRDRRAEAGDRVNPGSCVAEIMGTELFTLTPDTLVASALRLAASKRVRHFLVIEDGSLTGIVCQSDLRQARETALVSACMKSPVLCIAPDTTVREAVDIMEQNAVGCLPVVTGAFLVGMITRDRLSRATGEVVREETPAPVTVGKDEPGDEEDLVCASCGKERGVRPNFRAAMVPLCPDCASVIPSSDPPRAN